MGNVRGRGDVVTSWEGQGCGITCDDRSLVLRHIGLLGRVFDVTFLSGSRES
jgi:hypothetical protein